MSEISLQEHKSELEIQKALSYSEGIRKANEGREELEHTALIVEAFKAYIEKLKKEHEFSVSNYETLLKVLSKHRSKE